MPDQYREPIEEQSGVALPASAPASSVEQEILELERQLTAKRAERQKFAEQTIGFEQAPPTSQPPVQPISPIATVSQPAEVKADADRISTYEKNQQIKSLVDLAFTKGATHATEVVRNLDNPYLIDEFHDTLIDEMRQQLIDKGKLEEI